MKPEDVMLHAPIVLTEAQRLQYFRDGFLVLPDYIPENWLTRLKQAAADLLDQSRDVSESNDVFTLEEGHSSSDPRLHRVTSPQDHHPVIWEFICSSVMTDLVADLVGPDVKFHHAKLNVKSGRGTRGFKWHQDIQAWPHTDYSPITAGVYLHGCRADQGPLSFIPGSHNGPLYSMYDEEGNFVVRVRDEDLAWLEEDMVVRPTGGPGTVVLLNCRTIHGSDINRSDDPRMLLLPVYSSADSFAYTPSPITSPHLGDIVRGKPAMYASFDARPCELPPDWRGGYKTAWSYQKAEEARKQQLKTAAAY